MRSAILWCTATNSDAFKCLWTSIRLIQPPNQKVLGLFQLNSHSFLMVAAAVTVMRRTRLDWAAAEGGNWRSDELQGAGRLGWENKRPVGDTPLCVMVAVHQALQSQGLPLVDKILSFSHICCTWPCNAAQCSSVHSASVPMDSPFLNAQHAGSQQLAVGTSFLSDSDLLKDVDGLLSWTSSGRKYEQCT